MQGRIQTFSSSTTSYSIWFNSITKVDDYNVLGQNCYTLKLNHCSCTYSCKCAVAYAKIDETAICYYNADHRSRLYRNCRVDQYGVLEAVNDSRVCADDIKRLLDKDLEQLSSLLPNLQSLDLTYCDLSTENIRGLRAVANSCLNLRGLKLKEEHASSLNPNALWQILSSMKLTYLHVERCLIPSSFDSIKQDMGSLFVTLQAITIVATNCKVCDNSSNKDLLICLSHFSSLNYCHLFHPDACHTKVAQDIATRCKKLKCLKMQSHNNSQLYPISTLLSSTYNHNLEQFGINSEHTIVPDEFMDLISAHGGLVNVFLRVSRITEKGIGILIKNSPNLMQLDILTAGEFNQLTFNSILMEMHNYQKLIARGIVRVKRLSNPSDGLNNEIIYRLFNPELFKQNNISLSLW